MSTELQNEEFDQTDLTNSFSVDLKEENVEYETFEEGNYNIKCHAIEGATTIDGYLGVTRFGWATITTKTHLWRLVPDKDDKTKFYLKSLHDPKDGYYLGHRKGSKSAGVYYTYASSDWLRYDEDSEKILNLDAKSGNKCTFFGRHREGGYYWITDKEAGRSHYIRIECTFEKVD